MNKITNEQMELDGSYWRTLDIVTITNNKERDMNDLQNMKALVPSTAVEVLPDSDRYKCRFKVRSSSSNRLYLVSYDAAAGYWTCSCRGNIRHGQCKHLTAAGLKGRKYGRQLLAETKAINAPTLQLAYQE